MSPAEISLWAAELRAAGRALSDRPRARTVESLGAVLEIWRDPESSARRRLEDELPAAAGFTREIVRAGLDRALEGWSPEALAHAVEDELRAIDASCGDGGGHALTGVILAGSIPMPSFLALLWPLLLHSPVLAKPASRDPLSAALFAESVSAVDPELGACLRVLPPDSDRESAAALIREAECLVASGSDESLAEIAQLRGTARPFIADGHRISVAALGSEIGAESAEEVARGLAFDVAAWDQLGCCSPLAVYVVGDEAAAIHWATQIGDELAVLGEKLPRGLVETEAAAVFSGERAEAEMRIAAGQGGSLHFGPSHCVVAEPDARRRPAPLHRFLRIHPVPDEAALLGALAPLGVHLAGVAMAGFGERSREIARAFAELGASRVCGPGRLQTPPIGWHHDGRPLLLPLSRLWEGERSGASR